MLGEFCFSFLFETHNPNVATAFFSSNLNCAMPTSIKNCFQFVRPFLPKFLCFSWIPRNFIFRASTLKPMHLRVKVDQRNSGEGLSTVFNMVAYGNPMRHVLKQILNRFVMFVYETAKQYFTELSTLLVSTSRRFHGECPTRRSSPRCIAITRPGAGRNSEEAMACTHVNISTTRLVPMRRKTWRRAPVAFRRPSKHPNSISQQHQLETNLNKRLHVFFSCKDLVYFLRWNPSMLVSISRVISSFSSFMPFSWQLLLLIPFSCGSCSLGIFFLGISCLQCPFWFIYFCHSFLLASLFFDICFVSHHVSHSVIVTLLLTFLSLDMSVLWHFEVLTPRSFLVTSFPSHFFAMFLNWIFSFFTFFLLLFGISHHTSCSFRVFQCATLFMDTIFFNSRQETALTKQMAHRK